MSLQREPGCVREILELAEEVISVGQRMQGAENERNGDADREKAKKDAASLTSCLWLLL